MNRTTRFERRFVPQRTARRKDHGVPRIGAQAPASYEASIVGESQRRAARSIRLPAADMRVRRTAVRSDPDAWEVARAEDRAAAGLDPCQALRRVLPDARGSRGRARADAAVQQCCLRIPGSLRGHTGGLRTRRSPRARPRCCRAACLAALPRRETRACTVASAPQAAEDSPSIRAATPGAIAWRFLPPIQE